VAKLVYGAVVAFAAACLLHAAPASAEIDVKAGCDGKWVERTGSGFETYKVCERDAPARASALQMRAHPHHRLAHARPHKRLAAHVVSHNAAAPFVVAAASPAPRRENECVNLNCPQYILIGIGY
jgi:hypothetical protein